MNEPAYPVRLQRLVEEYLEGLDFGADRRAARLVEAMRYSLLAGGKRIRPVLTLATAESRGAEPASVLPTAAALELVHTYSLIHDDLPSIDDDELRRGRPTCHVVYGEDVAILAGDGLFSEAFHLVLDAQEADRATLLAVVTEIARATGVGGMVGGQFMDVAGLAADAADLRTMHALKTGRLIEAAIVAGALLGGRGPASRARPAPSSTSSAPIAPSRPSSACSSRSSTTSSTRPVMPRCWARPRARTAGRRRRPTSRSSAWTRRAAWRKRPTGAPSTRCASSPGSTAVLREIADYILRRRY